MAVTPDGSGTSWTEAAPDIDQPIGLIYRANQDLRKGVRKRAEQEHSAFADNTIGLTHKPGGCAILDIVDQTIDISIDDDTYKGRNIIYDQTGSSLWCFTNTDGTASTPNGYRLMWGPKSICSGGDYTWTGAHEFDASVDISGNVAIDGDFSVDGTAVFDATGTEFGGTAGLGLFYDPTVSVGGESVTLPNGTIIKSGFKADAGGDTDISFSAAFPNAIVSVNVSPDDTVSQGLNMVIAAYAATGFTVRNTNALDGYHWIAIGY